MGSIPAIHGGRFWFSEEISALTTRLTQSQCSTFCLSMGIEAPAHSAQVMYLDLMVSWTSMVWFKAITPLAFNIWFFAFFLLSSGSSLCPFLFSFLSPLLIRIHEFLVFSVVYNSLFSLIILVLKLSRIWSMVFEVSFSVAKLHKGQRGIHFRGGPVSLRSCIAVVAVRFFYRWG